MKVGHYVHTVIEDMYILTIAQIEHPFHICEARRAKWRWYNSQFEGLQSYVNTAT